jgi:hypothetical protein
MTQNLDLTDASNWLLNHGPGDNIGDAEGALVGLPDGAIDGIHEGMEVGDNDGTATRFELGSSEGPR